jgi:hypothetical protein
MGLQNARPVVALLFYGPYYSKGIRWPYYSNGQLDQEANDARPVQRWPYYSMAGSGPYP